jgi:hypothetical protein
MRRSFSANAFRGVLSSLFLSIQSKLCTPIPKPGRRIDREFLSSPHPLGLWYVHIDLGYMPLFSFDLLLDFGVGFRLIGESLIRNRVLLLIGTIDCISTEVTLEERVQEGLGEMTHGCIFGDEWGRIEDITSCLLCKGIL